VIQAHEGRGQPEPFVFLHLPSQLRLGLHRLPISDFPLLRSLAPALAGYDGAAELERGLDILLTGLTTTLTPPGQPTPARASTAPAR
jgi:hypothetical protein